MPTPYTPDATSPNVMTFPGYAYNDPYAYVTHNNGAVSAKELADHQSLSLWLRGRMQAVLGGAGGIGLQAGLLNGLQNNPDSVLSKAVAFRVDNTDDGRTFTNAAALASMTATLPASPRANMTVNFCRQAAYDFVITGSALDYADQQGTTLTLSVNGFVTLKYIGGRWTVTTLSGGAPVVS